MCTLILLDRVVPGIPLVVASNRDEYYARPAAFPARVASDGGAGGFVAPQDLEAGGTWMGANAHGMFVGLTNRPIEERSDGRRSRGLLVTDALRRPSPSAAVRDLGSVRPDEYNPFNLLCADGRETWIACLRDDGLETRSLDPGPHVLCNRDVDDAAVAKVAAIQAELAALDFCAPFARLFEDLTRLLASHRDPGTPLDNVCVHTEGYGTRSSAIWALGGARSRFWYADGPPCESKYRNLTALLDELQPAHRS